MNNFVFQYSRRYIFSMAIVTFIFLFIFLLIIFGFPNYYMRVIGIFISTVIWILYVFLLIKLNLILDECDDGSINIKYHLFNKYFEIKKIILSKNKLVINGFFSVNPSNLIDSNSSVLLYDILLKHNSKELLGKHTPK